MQMQCWFWSERLSAILIGTDKWFDSLMLRNLMLLQLHIRSTSLPYLIGISKGLVTFGALITMIHMMPQLMLPQQPHLAIWLSARRTHVVLRHRMRQVDMRIERRLGAEELPTLGMWTFVRFWIRVNGHVNVEWVSCSEGLVTSGTHVRFPHVLDHHFVFVEKLGDARHGRIHEVFRRRNVREHFLFAHVEIGFAQLRILLKEHGNLRQGETLEITGWKGQLERAQNMHLVCRIGSQLRYFLQW